MDTTNNTNHSVILTTPDLIFSSYLHFILALFIQTISTTYFYFFWYGYTELASRSQTRPQTAFG